MNTIGPFEEMQSQPAAKEVANPQPEPTSHVDGFNWSLPVLGALGFGFAFAWLSAIAGTSFDILSHKVDTSLELSNTSAKISLFRGIIVGAIGAGMMGLAYKDKTRTAQFFLRGALGFGAAFGFVVLINFDFSLDVLNYLLSGAFVGLIGGFVLGVRAKTDRQVLPLFLGMVGASWFAIAFTIGYFLPVNSCASWNEWAGSSLCSPWDGWGGAIGGVLFGVTLAIYEQVGSQKTKELYQKKKG